MDAETRRMLAIAEGMAKSQAALGNDGSALAWSEMAATRLAAERDEARKALERVRQFSSAIEAGREPWREGVQEITRLALAALTQEAAHGQS